MYQSSSEGQDAMVMTKDTRKVMVIKCPTFGSFLSSLSKRMGEVIKQDKTLAVDILKEIFVSLDEEWNENTSNKMRVAMEGCFYFIAYCCTLRGEEVPMVDLYGITKHWKEGHVVVALLGCFKGGTGESYHLMPIVDVTSRGLEPRKWIGHLIHEYKMKGIKHGPLSFRSSLGHRARAGDVEDKFFERLEMIKET